MIEARGLSLQLGNFRLTGVDLKVASGEYAVLMGRTGSGKTSLLEALCGLVPVRAGTVIVNGRDVTRAHPSVRGIGYVPQDGALFSTMTVEQHLAFALRLRRAPRDRIAARVDALAQRLALGDLLPRRPHGLSGGERQRVALGRALAFEPPVLLLDEPLSAVDEDTRDDVCDLLASIAHETGVTTLHVTHSTAEAHRLADRVLRLTDHGVQPVTLDSPPPPHRTSR